VPNTTKLRVTIQSKQTLLFVFQPRTSITKFTTTCNSLIPIHNSKSQKHCTCNSNQQFTIQAWPPLKLGLPRSTFGSLGLPITCKSQQINATTQLVFFTPPLKPLAQMSPCSYREALPRLCNVHGAPSFQELPSSPPLYMSRARIIIITFISLQFTTTQHRL
jgi:hypothetical protein